MTFNLTEKYQSQIPALQMLVAMGFMPLSQSEVLTERDHRLSNVILDNILIEQLLRINSFTHRGKEHPFTPADAAEAVRRLKSLPNKNPGLRKANQEIYDTLILGTTITKTMGGDSKSHSFRFIDWENPLNNAFHVTAEFSVERTRSDRTSRCDIVAFVNGIPFIIIENKRPTTSVKKAQSDLIGYQNRDNIPHLFHFAQLLLSMNRQEARYATVGTSQKFWQNWREEETPDDEIAPLSNPNHGTTITTIENGIDNRITSVANHPLDEQEKGAIFSDGFAEARPYFDNMISEGERTVTSQDRTLYALCRPERLLDIVRRFTVFDNNERKIARHQQFFGVRAAIESVKQRNTNNIRRGGVVWHTQGSGKSLTMVMLGRALKLDREILNPRIIIVTDRKDLDQQIKATFKSCELQPTQAKSGRHLLELIRDKNPLITTVINKFDSAMQARIKPKPDADENIFVLVDEGHRTQTGRYGGYGQFANKMRRILPKACYLGFTGTPLLQKEKNTLATFGGLIHKYTIDAAIQDGAVVPLLYEGRIVDQQVEGDALDMWFEKISEGLNKTQKADLRNKYSRMNILSKTRQAIRAKAFDISGHFRRHFQTTDFKAQLVAPSKAAAVRFKDILDDIGHVSSEIIISAPNNKEGSEEVDKESKDLVQRFWQNMMKKYKTEEEYNRQIMAAFKASGAPEILIVVSKLLTGFDVPRNTVLYVCKSMKEHNLLQAIARVNRLYEEGGEEKQYGFIVDYEGLLGDLDQALETYGNALEGYDADDLTNTFHDIRKEIRRLPQLHAQLWHLFRTIGKTKDMERFEQFLADEARRKQFYQLLSKFSRCLHISLSSDKVFQTLTDKQIETMKRDYKRFSELKRSIQIRYQETVNMSEFKPKIEQLLDDHVAAKPARTIIPPVDINDPQALNKIIEETETSAASKADRIVYATRREITEKMPQDPDFYRRFSELLEATIQDYRNKRISEREYLNKARDIASKVASGKRDDTLPASIKNNRDGQAFFGVVRDILTKEAITTPSVHDMAEISLALVGIVKQRMIVDIWSNTTAQNKIRNTIDDYCCEVMRDQKGIELTEKTLNNLVENIMRLAEARFPR